MIMRLWRAYAPAANADAYQAMISIDVLPGFHRYGGYRGAHVLRRESAPGEVEFIVITTWESWEAVREFGGGHAKAVIWPEAAALLSRYDEEAVHYEAAWVP